MANTIRICHLYSDLMDTYGDIGNITAIQKRFQWRDWQTQVTSISVGQTLKPNNFDLFFFGGGQDKAQEIVALDLKSKAAVLHEYIEKGTVLLAICGGYQLLQKYFKTQDEKQIDGIGIFDAYTTGSNIRMIDNLLIETENTLQGKIEIAYPANKLPSPYLIGFENHSGKTYLGTKAKPLGGVISGSGNNGEDQTEGAIYKNAFGCYLHGSLLPKNPHFTDLLIATVLKNKGYDSQLTPLDDEIEWLAHNQAVEKTRSSA